MSVYRTIGPLVESKDGKVRKVEVRVFQNDKQKTFSRPISELIFLLSEEQ